MGIFEGTSCPQVEIVTLGHFAKIPAEVAGIVKSHADCCLSCTTRDFSAGSTGVQSHSITHSFYQTLDDGTIQFAAGLVPRLAQHLERQGYAVEIRDETWWLGLEAARRSAITSDVPEEMAFFQAVCRNPRGQVLASGPKQANDCIASLRRLITTGQTLVIAPNNKRATALLRHLKRTLGRRVVRSQNRRPGCVGVCTLEKYPANRYWNVAIFDGVETVLAKQVRELAGRNDQQLQYCIRYPGGRPLSRFEVLTLESICGRVIYPEPAAPPVTLTVLVRTPTIRVRRGISALERKRLTLWHHDARNASVAQVARAAASGDCAALRQLGVDLPHHAAARSVTIVVESTEHAQALHALLPDWHIASNIPDAAGIVQVPCGLHRCITTETFVHDHGLDSELIIRASGKLPTALHDNRSAIVIDFDPAASGRTSPSKNLTFTSEKALT